MDRIETMKRFVAVARTESFTQAAEQLNVPKSAISSSISQLESHLKTRLLNRSTRRVNLTEAGERYLPRCIQLLEELDILEEAFQTENQSLSGMIRIDMPSRFLSTIVMPRLSEWFELHPHTQIHVLGADHRIDPIKERVDCVIRAGKLDNNDLIAKPLGQMEMVNCASPDYLARYGTPTRLDDLSQHFIVDYTPNQRQNNSEFEYFNQEAEHTIPVPSVISVSTTDAYLSAALHGLGIIQLPKNGVKEYLRNGELVEVLPEFQCQPMPIAIIYQSRQQMPKRIRCFMEWIESIFLQQ
ncbi:LysR family transcriptional regulator [Vibrio gangliei]|uniref:LysR family transcriptional regulator n=1 Tax=Vibrio gangliei TaxID=2077090 RepID=UPI000D01E938|nr:LysR family transcriptional regulator [Vibrio gangliei]